MTRWLIVVAALACGCKKEASPTGSSGTPVSTADQDALWAKAPDGAMVGIVASPRAITMTEHAWQDVHAFLKSLPEFAPVEQKMSAQLAQLGMSSDFTYADLGMGPAKGAAVFVLDKGRATIGIVPLVDRDKMLAKMKGTKGADVDKLDDATCKPIDGGYYACATDPALFARLGKGNLRAGLDAAKARGDIEVVVDDPIKLAGVLQLERGTVVARGVVSGPPAEVVAKLGTPVESHVDLEHVSGFAVMNVTQLLEGVPPIPLVGGVTIADLVKSIDGPVRVTVASGDFGMDARVSLRDDKPAKTLIEHCADLPPQLNAKLDGTVCKIPVPQFQADFAFTVEGKELHFKTKGTGGTTTDSAPGALGSELAKGAWSVALWGHGTILAPTPNNGAMPWQQMPDEAAVAIHAIAMLNELGLGVRTDGDAVRFVLGIRTGWANPDDVVAKLVKLDPQAVVDGKGGELGKAIADSAPKSPFAGDYKSGYGGLLIPTAVVGILAAVAIPAFLDYQRLASGHGRHGPTMEARLFAKKLAFEAYPQWAAAHPDKECPKKLDELMTYVDVPTTTDPWGNPYLMKCGANLPAGVKGIAIYSYGPDGKEGTDDDIKSWEP